MIRELFIVRFFILSPPSNFPYLFFLFILRSTITLAYYYYLSFFFVLHLCFLAIFFFSFTVRDHLLEATAASISISFDLRRTVSVYLHISGETLLPRYTEIRSSGFATFMDFIREKPTEEKRKDLIRAKSE